MPSSSSSSRARSDTAESILKVLLVGESFVGKSSLAKRYTDAGEGRVTRKQILQQMQATIGFEMHMRAGVRVPPELGGGTVAAQVWDTAGLERFRSITRGYYRGSQGALLVFDHADRDSFAALPYWASQVVELASPSVALLVVANKSDIRAGGDEVPRADIDAMCVELAALQDRAKAAAAAAAASSSSSSSAKLAAAPPTASAPPPSPSSSVSPPPPPRALPFVRTSAALGEGVEEAFSLLINLIVGEMRRGAPAVGKGGVTQGGVVASNGQDGAAADADSGASSCGC